MMLSGRPPIDTYSASAAVTKFTISYKNPFQHRRSRNMITTSHRESENQHQSITTIPQGNCLSTFLIILIGTTFVRIVSLHSRIDSNHFTSYHISDRYTLSFIKEIITSASTSSQ